MKQVWISGQRSVQVRQVDVPTPGPDEVLVAVSYAGICGSDLHTYYRGHPWLGYPIRPGHEAAGVVVASDPHLQPALNRHQRVYIRPVMSCGTCPHCSRGATNLCASLTAVGSHMSGALAEYVCVPSQTLAAVPAGVTLSASAMIEPLATAVHAANLAGRPNGRSVLILGAGAIGQCLLLVTRRGGAANIIITDPVSIKRALAADLGADHALEPNDSEIARAIGELPSRRADVVFDCVANAGSFRTALNNVTPGGTVVIVGVGHQTASFPIIELQDHEVAIRGSAMYVASDFTRAEALVADGLPVERLISDTLPLRRFDEAFAAALSGDAVRVQIRGDGPSDGE